MNLFDSLFFLPVVKTTKRKEGYFVSRLYFEKKLEKQIRDLLYIKEKHIEIAKVHIPAETVVNKHLHMNATEFFISKNKLRLILDDKAITVSGMIKIPKNTPHSIEGEQTLYVIKAYENEFDKQML
ncbi:MAG: hypothetical protein ACOCZQ_01800 [Nanoarchaeota archaeon]